MSSVPHSRKTKHIDDSDLQHSWSSQAAIAETSRLSKMLSPHIAAMKSQTCIRRLRILSVFSFSIVCVCVCSRAVAHCTPPQYPAYPSTAPTGPLPPYPSTAPLHCTHRTLPLYPLYPSTVPTPSYPFSKNITQPILHFCQPILHFCRPILHFCRPTFWVQWVGYSGTAQGVQWDGTSGTVIQFTRYSGRVQGVQWYSARGVVVQQGGCGGTVCRDRHLGTS